MNNFDMLTLRCPICGEKMFFQNEKTLCCFGLRKHSYDVSSSGYVNLASPKQCGGGDTKEAVRARTSFLELGFYDKIANKTIELLQKNIKKNATVLDAGCGEGYYSLKIAEQGFFVLGVDISKMAVEAASKRARREKNEKLFFAVASVFELPTFEHSVDAVVNVFAPCVESEYTRVLKDDGVLIVAHAGKNHLMGLKEKLYDNIYQNDERADLPKDLELIAEESLKYNIFVQGNQNIKNLFAMTPYYWRTSQNDAKKLDKIEELQTEVDIIFSIYGKKTDGKKNG